MENYTSNEEKKTFKLTHYISLIGFAGIAIGAAGGFLYYYFVGCQTGTCAITSNPWISTVWGAVMGYLVFDMFKKKKNTENVNQE